MILDQDKSASIIQLFILEQKRKNKKVENLKENAVNDKDNKNIKEDININNQKVDTTLSIDNQKLKNENNVSNK